MTSLDWTLYHRKGKRSRDVCDVSFLDFGGEVYRRAFSDRGDAEAGTGADPMVAQLLKHIAASDTLLVLINLKDAIDGDRADEQTRDMVWASQRIIEHADRLPKLRHLAIAFSQYGKYREIVEHDGGLQAAFAKYLPNVEGCHPDVKLLAVSAVEDTRVDAAGRMIPVANFRSEGLDTLLDWIASTGERARKLAAIRRWMIVGTILAGIGGVAAIGGLMIKAKVDAEREAARMQREAELGRLRDRGYEIDGTGESAVARWKAGRIPSANTNLITTLTQDEYRSLRAGYEWRRGTLKDVWVPGRRHPDRRDVVSGDIEGRWQSTRPGYDLDKRLEFVWKPGKRHPLNGRLTSMNEEGEWKSEVGWKWVGGTNDLWQVGVLHPDNATLVSADAPDTWQALEPGYEWAGGSRTRWVKGKSHPEKPTLISDEAEGRWRSTEEGWTWTSGTNCAWCEGVESKKYPHWVSTDKPNVFRASPGYVRQDPSAKGMSELVWSPGMVVDGRKAASKEGRWLKKVNCPRCKGTEKIEKEVSCQRCEGRRKVPGKKTCYANGCQDGYVEHIEGCGACGGTGMGMRRCSGGCSLLSYFAMGEQSQGWGFRCRCGGNLFCNSCYGMGFIACRKCGGCGQEMGRCGTCEGNGRVKVQRKCLICDGSGEVKDSVTCPRCDGEGRVRKSVRCDNDDCQNGKVWAAE